MRMPFMIDFNSKRATMTHRQGADNSTSVFFMRHLRRIFFLVACVFMLSACDSKVGVSIGAVGHLDGNVGISDFYVNGAWGGNNGGQTVGNAGVCCVMIPHDWRPGLVANVNWEECDITGIVFKNHRAVDPNARCKKSEYEATVPIPKYDEPGSLLVHFFPEHKVAVVVSAVGPLNPDYRWPVMKGYYPDYVPTWAKAQAIGIIEDKGDEQW